MNENINANNEIILTASNITKSYGGSVVLNDVSMSIKKGKVLTFVGENGAGKSTLINILSGLVSPDCGSMTYEGSKVSWSSPAHALKNGIAVVHQELTLFKNLTVAENIFVGNRSVVKFGKLDRKFMAQRSREILSKLGLEIDVNTLVENLTVAQQQLVEIAKAISWNPKLLILDEATSALDTMQVENLFKYCRELLQEDIAMVFVSHRTPEMFDIADEALVIKDGNVVGFYPELKAVTEQDLINCMVGYSIQTSFPEKNQSETRPPVLEIESLSTDFIKDVSMYIRPGEIIGLGGLRGHGQEELLRTLFGLEKVKSGNITIEGKPYTVKDVSRAISEKFAYVPPDRKKEGAVLSLPIENNLTIPVLGQVSKALGWLNRASEESMIDRTRKRLSIDQRNWHQTVAQLSGGNQQKIVIGKWLESDFKILLMDEPTRGVDVATKHEIYLFLRELTKQGLSVLLVSTDMLELIGISDRIYIFYEGRIHKELTGCDITEENVTYAIMGLQGDKT